MNVLEEARKFKRKYPLTVAWRLKAHCKIANMHIADDEKVLYVFVAQKNNHPLDFTSTNVIVLTNKALILARKRLVFGYFLTTITPDLYNDMQVMSGIIWGKLIIDTVKEEIVLSNIDPNALPEIENTITDYMQKKKRNYVKRG